MREQINFDNEVISIQSRSRVDSRSVKNYFSSKIFFYFIKKIQDIASIYFRLVNSQINYSAISAIISIFTSHNALQICVIMKKNTVCLPKLIIHHKYFTTILKTLHCRIFMNNFLTLFSIFVFTPLYQAKKIAQCVWLCLHLLYPLYIEHFLVHLGSV